MLFRSGDGYRNPPLGSEKILETFYSWGLTQRQWLTLNVQHVQNPAYNRERGPVRVTALRWHAEF